MLWGILDLVIVVFFVSLAVKLFNKAKEKFSKFLVVAFFICTMGMSSEMVMAEQWVEVPHGEDYCPYGDAVITDKTHPDEPGVLVNCILYDRKQECWDTWIENAKGERLHQCWEIDQYDAWTMDGQLTIHPKTDEVVIKPTGKVLSDDELQATLAKIFKEVKHDR